MLRIFGVFSLILLLTGCAPAGRPDAPAFTDWLTVFEYDFTSDQSKNPYTSEWEVLSGTWQTGPDGLIKADPAEYGFLAFRSPLAFGALRVEYEVRSDRPHDLSLIMGSSLKSGLIDAGAALFAYSTLYNTGSGIQRPGGILHIDHSRTAAGGRWHTVVCEREKGLLRLSVDGQQIMEQADSPEGLAGPFFVFRFSPEGTGILRRVRISARVDPVLRDFLTPAARKREKIFPSCSRPAPRRREALFGPGALDEEAVLKLAAAAPALPAPAGRIVKVDTVRALADAINSAIDNTTIMIAPGTYDMPWQTTLRADNVAIRGVSGERGKVILDGSTNFMHRNGAMLMIKGADNVLLADLTFRNSKKYAVMIYGDSGVRGFKAYNVVFRNIWARGLKGTTALHKDDNYRTSRYGPEMVDKVRPTGGEVRYCLFAADHIKTDRKDGFNGDYIAGIDMMHLKDWKFTDNVFIGLRGANGIGRGAIFLWIDSQDVLIERNLFVNNDRSIALGNPSYNGISMARAIIRDNHIVTGVDKGIECWGTRDVTITGNRIFTTMPDYLQTVELAHGAEGGVCEDNLIHGHLVVEKGVTCRGNTVGDLTGTFRNPAIGDLRLIPED